MMYDAAVIGAGPAGITAALYLVRSGVSVALIENSAPGGQILATAEIENYPGFPKSVKGWELADLFDALLENGNGILLGDIPISEEEITLPEINGYLCIKIVK